MYYLLAVILALNTGGYFEYGGQNWKAGENYPYTDYGKIDINIEQNYNNTFMNTEFGYITYHGKTQYNLKEYLPGIYNYIPSIPYPLSSGIFIRNAYAGFKWKSFCASLGKQQIGWGTGYFYNPTNLFQYRTIQGMNEEINGVNSLKLKINLPFDIGMETVILPKAILDSSSVAGEVKGYFSLIDLSLGFADYIYTYFDSTTVMQTAARFKSILADFSTNISDINFYGEGFYNLEKKQTVAVLGMRYSTPDNSSSINLEYLYNGYGKSSNYNLSDWMNFLSGYQLSLGKHELTMGINKSINNGLLKFSIATLYNPVDKTGLLLPEISLFPNENSEIVLTPFIPFGKENPNNGGSEYTNFPFGEQFRLKVNF